MSYADDHADVGPTASWKSRLPLSSLFRPGLNVQILAIVAVASLLGTAVASVLVLSLQRFQCIEHTQRTNLQWANVLQAAMLPSMQAEAHTPVELLVRSLADRTNMERVRLLNADGVVLVSSEAGEIGGTWTEAEAQRRLAASTTLPAAMHWVRHHGSHDDAVTFTPLYNQASCQGCHGAQADLLGAWMIETPLSTLTYRITEGLWRIFLSIAITFALLVGVLTYSLQRLISWPVADLSRGVSEIANGNLDSALTIHNHNELGDLARSFDQMRRQLKSSRAVMERQNQELWLLSHLDIQISASLDAEQIFQTVAEGARRLLKSDIGIVGLYDEDTQAIRVHAGAGDGAQVLREMSLPLATCEFLWANDGQTPPTPLRDAGIVSILAVPVFHHDALQGAIAVMTRHPRDFTEDERRFMSRLADQMVTATENARLHAQARHVAALEERERLAREIHDRLAQTLGYLNIKASLIADQLAKKQLAEAQQGFQELKSVLSESYIDVREAIFNLRTSVPATSEFVGTLQNYLDDYQVHYHLETHLQWANGEPLRLSDNATIQLLRIIQEALTNVRKHARAGHARVLIRQDDDHVHVSIEDDGCGFVSEPVAGDSRISYGLQIMRERAESVGGQVTIESVLGQGTSILVKLPTVDEYASRFNG